MYGMNLTIVGRGQPGVRSRREYPVDLLLAELSGIAEVLFEFVGLEKNPSGGGNIIVAVGYFGWRYQLRYKDRLEAPTWTDLPGTGTIDHSGYVRLLDSTASAAWQRFYRVVLVE